MSKELVSYSSDEMEEKFGKDYNMDSFTLLFNENKKLLIVKTKMPSGIEASHQFQVRRTDENGQINPDMIIEDVDKDENKIEVICTNCDRTSRDVLDEIGFNTKNKVTSTTD